MIGREKDASRWATVAVSQEQTSELNSITSPDQVPRAIALWMLTHGYASAASTEAKLKSHPGWK
jgi:hypothetical protein